MQENASKEVKLIHIKVKEKKETMSKLMEQILSRENMKVAYKKVKANKGASGIDGVEME